MLPNFLQDLFKNQQYNPDSFFLIAGPCVVESEEIVMEIADTVSNHCKRLGIPYVFKASYRKAEPVPVRLPGWAMKQVYP